MSISQKPWGSIEGKEVALFTLSNGGINASITSYGGILTSLLVPDAKGGLADVVLGYDDLPGFIKGQCYFNAICGRVANRVAGGSFSLDGHAYTLATNNGPNHLHGGLVGFDRRIWEATTSMTPAGPVLRLRLEAKDGEEGYPGHLQVEAAYTLTAEGTLLLEMTAVCDRATPINLTHHAYFNLAGHEARGAVQRHLLRVEADSYTPVDGTSIPTGQLAAVANTPFDFLRPTPIGARLQAAGGAKGFEGYDHNYALNGGDQAGVRPVAWLEDPGSGRVLTVLTDAPGLQLYAGNYVPEERCKGGVMYGQHQGVCLEAQGFPDAINQPSFPCCVLRPGQTFRRSIGFRFSTTQPCKL